MLYLLGLGLKNVEVYYIIRAKKMTDIRWD